MVWLNQGVGDISAFINIFKTRCLETFKLNWQLELAESSKARFYRSFKLTFFHSHYLENVIAPMHRIALTRLIVSSHKLHVESGRWTTPITPIGERKCPYCPDKVEDEYHLLVESIFYQDLRARFIPRLYWNRPSMHKAIQSSF